MQIQPISNSQNFNGRFLFLKPNMLEPILSEDIERYMPTVRGKDLAEVQKTISSYPFDLYISKSEDLEGFWELNASANLKKFLIRRTQGKVRPALLKENKIDRLISTANEAIYKYEKSPEYYEDIKSENLLKLLFKKIFKKG